LFFGFLAVFGVNKFCFVAGIVLFYTIWALFCYAVFCILQKMEPSIFWFWAYFSYQFPRWFHKFNVSKKIPLAYMVHGMSAEERALRDLLDTMKEARRLSDPRNQVIDKSAVEAAARRVAEASLRADAASDAADARRAEAAMNEAAARAAASNSVSTSRVAANNSINESTTTVSNSVSTSKATINNSINTNKAAANTSTDESKINISNSTNTNKAAADTYIDENKATANESETYSDQESEYSFLGSEHSFPGSEHSVPKSEHSVPKSEHSTPRSEHSFLGSEHSFLGSEYSLPGSEHSGENNAFFEGWDAYDAWEAACRAERAALNSRNTINPNPNGIFDPLIEITKDPTYAKLSRDLHPVYTSLRNFFRDKGYL
jgi:hypothetical protein